MSGLFSFFGVGLSISLMERFSAARLTDIHFLDIQHRMHPSILEFPNKQFYNGRISSIGVNDRTRPPIAGFTFPNSDLRVCLIEISRNADLNEALESIKPIAGSSGSSSGSKYNSR